MSLGSSPLQLDGSRGWMGNGVLNRKCSVISHLGWLEVASCRDQIKVITIRFNMIGQY